MDPDPPTNADYQSLVQEAETLAEALDDFRERLIAAGTEEGIVALWFDTAVHAWDAVNAMSEGADGAF